MSEPEIYEYTVKACWQKEKLGVITTGNHVTLGFSPPPEFGGHTNLLTPEDAFVAAETMCMMVNFLHFAEKLKVDFTSAQIDAKGIMEEEEKNRWAITRIYLFPKIGVKEEKEIKKAERALILSKKNCLIGNSIRSEVLMEPEIWVEDTDD